MLSPCCFDAVLFDLDGTLIATDRFWVQAARTGARRAFDELGLDLEIPSAQRWLQIVGFPSAKGFEMLFPDLEAEQREAIKRSCLEEEQRLLASGGSVLMPGAEQILSRLREAGLAIGVASNCSQRYLNHMLVEAGLSRWIDEALCLDSPGITSKAHMIAELLERFATRSALMVGDRSSDRDAAWENGIPHVHCAFGFAGREEEVEAEARIEDLGDLIGVLDARRAWVEAALERSGILRTAVSGPRTLGVTGPPAAGKSLFARDAVRILCARGQPAVVVPLAAFAREGREPAQDCDDCLDSAFDLAALDQELLEPRTRGEAVRLGSEPGLAVAAGDLLVLEGPFLLDPRLSSRLDRILHLEAPEEVLLRRIAGRSVRYGGSGPLEGARGSGLPLYREHTLRFPPERLADAVVDASNALGSGFACRTG